MSFLDHLEELRWHLVRSMVAVVVLSVLAFLSKEIIFGQIILGPSRTDFWTYQALCQLSEILHAKFLCVEELPFIIQNRQMTAQFTMHIASSVVAGVILAFPYIFWEFWRFISPGLYHNERKASRGAVFFVTFLFGLGITFGYFLLSPISINFLMNYQLDPSILNEIDLTSYVNTVIMLVLSSGLMFQLPIVVFFLSKAGIVTPQFLRSYRKHAIVVILIISAIITPPDIFSQVLISLPILLLYEISIQVSRFVIKKERKYWEEDEDTPAPLDQIQE